MKREEFLKQLEQLLDGISEEEKADERSDQGSRHNKR